MANPIAVISPTFATTLCIFHTVLYVGVLYLSPSTRPRAIVNPSDIERPNDPNYIRLRSRAVTFATIVSLLITLCVVKNATGLSWFAAQKEMGLWPKVGLWGWLKEVGIVMGLVWWLFMGSLWEKFVVGEGWRWEELRRDWEKVRYTWAGWKNIVVGPVTEELVFRAGMVPLHVLAGRNFGSIVWTTPLFFGIAHIHHLYEFYLRNPTRLTLGILGALFQFVYTTMFGWFAVFVFLRTGCIWNVILVHSFCNFIGLPTVGRIHNQHEGIVWGKWVDYMLWAGHAAGVMGFYKMLWPLTEGREPLMRI